MGRRPRAERVLPAELVDLLRHVAATPAEVRLRRVVAEADLADGPVVVGELETERAVQRLRWLLHRVGEGLALTSAGWLPPAVVTAATDELALDRQRIGKGNREDLTEPVRRLRQSAQRLGLLRVAKGRCCRRARAQRCARTPAALLRHVHERLVGALGDAHRGRVGARRPGALQLAGRGAPTPVVGALARAALRAGTR